MITKTEVLDQVESASKPGTFHTIRRGLNGTVYCDCWAWKRYKTCAHLTDYYEREIAKINTLSQDEIDEIAMAESSEAEAKMKLLDGEGVTDLKAKLAKTEAKLANVSARLNDIRPTWNAFKETFWRAASTTAAISHMEQNRAQQAITDIDELLK